MKRCLFIKSVFIFIFSIGCVQKICAQQHPTDSAKIYEIKEIVISTTQINEVIPAQRLSGEQLNHLSSYSVADAIRYFSGIQLKDYGGIGGLKTVDIRSMGSNQVGVFYDGVQLGNAQNGQVDLGKFSLDNIEEIALYHGQKSEIFQSAKDFGAAGAIYLKTRRPTFEKGKKFRLKTVFKTGSFGLVKPSVLWEQKISKTISSSFNAEYTYATGKYKFRYHRIFPDGTVAYDTTAVRQNGDIQAFRLEAGLHGFHRKLLWNSKIYFYNSEQGIPGAIVNNVWHHAQRQWDRNFFTQTSITAPLHSKYELLSHFKYSNNYLHYLNPDTTLKYIDQNYLQHEIYACFANKVSILKNWEVSLATDFQWNALQANLYNFAQPQRYTTLVALATAAEVWRIKLQASVLTTLINDKVASNFDTKTPPKYSKFTPAVFLSYKPLASEEFYVRAFFKSIFRMPTFNDLYYNEIGGISLLPEKADQYNLGVKYSKLFKKGIIENISLQTDAYYNEISDRIVGDPRGNSRFSSMLRNIGLVKIRGIDAATQLCWKFPYDIRVRTQLNYTFQKAQDFSDPSDNDPVAGTYRGQIDYIPWHSGSFTLAFIFKTYELNYSFIYIGERYRNSSNIPQNYEQPWYTHDLSLGKTFRFKTGNLKISAEINNLLNQQYEVVLNYPMPGTNFRIILKFEI